MEIKLTGHCALITGGSKGLGLAMATRFASSGADVAILARDSAGLEAAKKSIFAEAKGKGKIIGVPCDVSKPDQIKSAFDSVVSALGRVDILVNNAGSSAHGKFEDVTDEMWQEDLDLKLFAAIRLARLAFPKMKEQGWGRIINVLNIGSKAPRGGSSPTAVSRAAGLALTKILSHEGAANNVLVNALLVGLIESDQVVRRHKHEGAGMTLEEFIRKNGANIPMKRMGKAEEFANIACFLASDQGGYITGTAINVDGGMSPVV